MAMAMEYLFVGQVVIAAQATGKDMVHLQMVAIQKHSSTMQAFPLLLG